MSEVHKDKSKYEDIIHLPHPVSASHPRMSISDRAAQFSPFAALTGHDAAIKETARLTGHRINLEESSQQLLDERLQWIREQIRIHPIIEFTYFMPDQTKAGGEYVTHVGSVKKINEVEQTIVLEDGKQIEIRDIIEVDGDIFRNMD